MAAFSDSEQKLLASVTNQDLRDSLALIRRAMEKIWAGDMPRIIQDYTDHGEKHCERLAGAVVQLLDANGGRPISNREMYLLLAGIYLHDIGMQCDVVKFPEIRVRAERLGAKFDVPISARSSNDYSKDEQAAIRKNHQYLSLAWIEHAFETGETVLGQAAKTIPDDLVDDLMDVCKHHTKAPISACPIAFQFYPNERKQLVAALLRFADELDIDQNRVSSPDVVKSFAIDPRNSVYWWLHHRTNISFSGRNVVILTIRLHPDDVARFGAFVHNAFIAEFRSKNLPVLTVLGQNGIPILIGDDSKVVEHKRAERLPAEIVQAFQAMQERRDPLADLADEVRTLLRAIRYEVSPAQRIGGRTMEMAATLDQGTVRQRVLVRCIDGEIAAADVDALDKVLDRKTPQGWLICYQRVSGQARKRAAEDDAFAVFNLADFLQHKIWGPYFDALTSLVEKDRIPELYVDLGCYKQDMNEQGLEAGRDRYDSLEAYIDTWLADPSKMHISVLGAFGAGKTWFCRHFAHRQLERYLKDPAKERMPLLITLRAFAKAMTAQQLINDALLEQYKLPFVGSAFEVFDEMNRRGKLLLILDGFDEMARQVDYQTVVDNFWELANLVDDSSKVILTSRTEYFRWAKESEKIFHGEEFGRRTIVLQPPRFEVLNLEPFTDQQIRTVIERRVGGAEGVTVADRILANQNLAEMARKPVLIELLLAALDEVSADVLENPAQVYLYATDKLLLRNITAEKTFTSTRDKLYFLCELAWEMIKSDELRIHYTIIPERIKSYFGDKIKDQHELDTWDFDLRNQTLLHRDAAGYYEFAHKSLAEYFVAFKFAAELGCLAPKFATTYTEAGGKPCEIPIEQKDVLGLAETFGAMMLRDEWMLAVRDLLVEMIVEDAAKRLWEVIDETRGKLPGQVNYAGGNAATLLSIKEESFIGAKLARTVLSGGDLSDVDLTGGDFYNATLREVDLTNSTLKRSDLRNTDLTNIIIGDPDSLIASISQNATLVAIGLIGNIRLWNLANGKEIATLKLQKPTKSLIYPVFHQDKDNIIGSSHKWVKIWDINTSEEIITIYPEKRDRSLILLTIHENGERIAGTSVEWIKVWNIKTGKELITIYPRKQDRYGMLSAFHPDGKRIAGGSQNWIKIWDIETGKELLTIPITTLSENTILPAFHPDGKRIAGGSQNWIKIWDIETGKELLKISSKEENSIAIFPTFHPNGRQIIGGSQEWIKVWDIETGKECLSIKSAEFDYANLLSLDRKGSFVSGIFRFNKIKVWDTNSGKIAHELEIKAVCEKMQISDAYGIDQATLEFFADRGAILDEEQQRTLVKLRKQREIEEQQLLVDLDKLEPAAKPKPIRKSRRKKTN